MAVMKITNEQKESDGQKKSDGVSWPASKMGTKNIFRIPPEFVAVAQLGIGTMKKPNKQKAPAIEKKSDVVIRTALDLIDAPTTTQADSALMATQFDEVRLNRQPTKAERIALDMIGAHLKQEPTVTDWSAEVEQWKR